VNKTLGERLIEYRRNHFMKQGDMVRLIGCSLSSYGRYEKDIQKPEKYKERIEKVLNGGKL